MMDKKSALNLNTKVHTGVGVASFILGIATILFLITSIMLSALGDRSDITIQYMIGLFEIGAIVTSIVGIVFGCLGELTKETLKRYAHLGIALNAIAIIVHVIVLINAY